MIKSILKLSGVQQLSKKEQQTLQGGDSRCKDYRPVPPGHGVCFINGCYYVYHCDDVCPNGTDPICHDQP